jgi:tetratricopeptide (TPR) repeat protein
MATTPPDARTSGEVALARRELAAVKAEKDVGRAKSALPGAAALVARARALDYPPLLGEALTLQGDILETAGDFKAAERTQHEAIWAAEEGHDDLTAARAWIELVQIVGDRLERTDEGLLLAEHARAALRRAGAGPLWHGELLNNIGNTYYRKGRHEEALKALQKAVALKLTAGEDSAAASGTLNNLALVLRKVGRSDEALVVGRRALAIKERALGPEHPAVGVSLTNLGTTLAEQGKLEPALELMQRGLQIKEKALGLDHPSVGIALANLGGVLRDVGRAEESLAQYRRAQTIFEKTFGPRHSMVAATETGIGEALLDLHKPAEALPPLERALALREAAKGDESELAETQFALARALWESGGDLLRARKLAQAARALLAADPRNARELAPVNQWLAAARGGESASSANR